MRSDFGLVIFLSILFLVMSVMGPCKAKKSCMQSSLGPSDLYSNGVMNPNYMWYRVGNKIQVPVVVDPNYTYKERRIILGGLYEIQYKTCIDFYIFNNTHVLEGYDYVYITKAKTGCWSHIGRVGNGAQEISLGKGCVNHRTAVHEMIHALGFAHEHVRSDRDSYVYIFWRNISPGRENNFAKRNTKSTDPYGPYDYASIMHYDRTAFSQNGQDTIKPHKYGAKIGVGKTMSQWDVKKLLRMYNCGGHHGGSTYDGRGFGILAHDDVSDFIDNQFQKLAEETDDEGEDDTEGLPNPPQNSIATSGHYHTPTRFLREQQYPIPNLRGHHRGTLTFPEEAPLTRNTPTFSQYAYREQFSPQDTHREQFSPQDAHREQFSPQDAHREQFSPKDAHPFFSFFQKFF